MDGAYASTPARRLPPLPPRLLSDERLAQLAAEGDGAAFAAIYRRYQDPLSRYCRTIVVNPEDASDAFQATMTSAFRALQGERREIRLKPWLYRIAHNEAISILRRRRPTEELDDATGRPLPDAAADAGARERLQELVADMNELAERQRATLVMRELSDLSYAEIAETFGMSPAAARQTVYEARKALHEMSEGRAMDCELIRTHVSDADGRLRWAPKVRAHLKSCPPCREFQAAIGTRRTDLAVLAPPVAPALAASMLSSMLGGGGAAAGGKSAAIAAAAGGGNLLAGAGAAKIVALAAVTVTAGVAGAGAVAERIDDRPNGGASSGRQAAPPASRDGRAAPGVRSERHAGGERARRAAGGREHEGRREARRSSGAPVDAGRPGGPIPPPRPGAPREAPGTPRGAQGAPVSPAPPTPQPAPERAPVPQEQRQAQAAPEPPAPAPTAPAVPEPPSAPVEAPRG